MKLLLDTHILLWALADSDKLPAQARLLIEDPENTIYYSVVCPWEVEIKHLNHPNELTFGAEEVEKYCRTSGFVQLPVKVAHIAHLQQLQRPDDAQPHKDPFDKIMVCQAAVESMLFLTSDKKVAEYTEPCILKV